MKLRKTMLIIIILLFAITPISCAKATTKATTKIAKGKNLKKIADFSKSIAKELAQDYVVDTISDSIQSSGESSDNIQSANYNFSNPSLVVPLYNSQPYVDTYSGLVSYPNNYGGWSVYYYDGTPLGFSAYNKNTGLLDVFDPYGNPFY